MAQTRVRSAVGSVAELLAGATERVPFSHADGKSGVPMERVVIDGQRFMVKHLCVSDDWIMRATGDIGVRPLLVWESGLLDRLPPVIDHAVEAMAVDPGPGFTRAALLMRDVGEWLVPEGDDPLPLEQHLRFLDHMAALAATFWGWHDDVGLTPLGNRYLAFLPSIAEAEAAIASGAEVPRIAVQGWEKMRAEGSPAGTLALGLLEDPSPLLRALAREPSTLVHGDWKAGNLGSHPDGRTILLDWAWPGAAPACTELAWYLSINRVRLPQTKEAAGLAFREALERHGIDTGPWWDRQLALCLLASFVQLGWEKALDGGDELAWWQARALEGAAFLT